MRRPGPQGKAPDAVVQATCSFPAETKKVQGATHRVAVPSLACALNTLCSGLIDSTRLLITSKAGPARTHLSLPAACSWEASGLDCTSFGLRTCACSGVFACTGDDATGIRVRSQACCTDPNVQLRRSKSVQATRDATVKPGESQLFQTLTGALAGTVIRGIAL